MMQHYLLYPRQVAGKAFREKAQNLLPLYKLQLSTAVPGESFPETSSVMEELCEYSSPICYAHMKGFRTGFED